MQLATCWGGMGHKYTFLRVHHCDAGCWLDPIAHLCSVAFDYLME
jgi:hypothetical protein